MNVNPEIFDPLKGFDEVDYEVKRIPLWWVAVLVIGVLIVLLLCGCSPKVVTVPEVHTEYIVRSDTFIKRDSIVRNDSVIIRMQGDTVTVERWHTKLVDRWRDRVVRDTMIRRDSVSVPCPVEKKLTRWQQVKIRLTDYILISAIILSMLYLLLRWLRRRSQH
jgi:hypothetical protein